MSLGIVLGALVPSRALAQSTRAQRRELERAEALLRHDLTPRHGAPTDPAIVLVREDQHLDLRFPVSIVFESDSVALLPEAMTSAPIAALLALLKRRHAWSAQLTIYTDTIGGASANQSFSADRAQALHTALVTAGAAADRLRANGAGPILPLDSNDTAEGRSRNRRIEIRFDLLPAPAANL
jgi:outer membrane protein OmpA-like peptidoglycan-associated protein